MDSIIGEISIRKNSLMGCHSSFTISELNTDVGRQTPIVCGFDFDGKHPAIKRVIREHGSRQEIYFTDTAYIQHGKNAYCLWVRIRKNYSAWETFISPHGLNDTYLTQGSGAESLYDIVGLSSGDNLTPWLSADEAMIVVDDALTDRVREHITYEDEYFDHITPRIKRDLITGVSSSVTIAMERNTHTLDTRPMEQYGFSSEKWNGNTEKYLIPDGCELAVNDLEMFSTFICRLMRVRITDMEITVRIDDIIEENISFESSVGYVIDRFDIKKLDWHIDLRREALQLFDLALNCYCESQGIEHEAYVDRNLSSVTRRHNTITIKKTFYGLTSVVISDAILKTRICYLFDLSSIILTSCSMASWGT